MWYLTSESDKRVMFVIPSKSIIIGRRVDSEVCNFAVPDDASISRKHATLSTSNNSLLLQDLGSRYGTFVNDFTNKIEINANIVLNENDTIKFGKMQSIWKVNKANLVTCTSTLKGENLQSVKVALAKIGGELKNDWDDTCKYLTMPAITLTIKVVLALVQGSYIVTTEFWRKCVESIEASTHLPDPALFVPQIVESTLNKEVVTFMPDPQRKTLFQGKKIVFFSRRQYEMYKSVLIKSSATPLLLSECRMTVSMLCDKDVLVIQYITTGATQETLSQKNQITEIVNLLKNKGRRVIADAEIGLAILYCNTQKYCNPTFSFTSEVVKQTSAENSKSSKVLAQESQDPAPRERVDNIKINESLVSDDKSLCSDRLSSKRKIEELNTDATNPTKKVATSCFVANIPNDRIKRRLSEEEDTNPSKKSAVENINGGMTSNNGTDGNKKTDGIFNFIDAPTGNQNKTKKLNLSRPQKRRLDENMESDGLFNFVSNEGENRNSEAVPSKQSMFSINRTIDNEDDDSVPRPQKIKTKTVTVEEISAMRGAKLKELMEKNATDSITYSMKKEKTEDLLEEMSNLKIGNTIVVTCNDLVIKKEAKYDTSAMEPQNTSVKNFKKFKKIWPMNKQVSRLSSPMRESNSFAITA